MFSYMRSIRNITENIFIHLYPPCWTCAVHATLSLNVSSFTNAIENPRIHLCWSLRIELIKLVRLIQNTISREYRWESLCSPLRIITDLIYLLIDLMRYYICDENYSLNFLSHLSSTKKSFCFYHNHVKHHWSYEYYLVGFPSTLFINCLRAISWYYLNKYHVSDKYD